MMDWRPQLVPQPEIDPPFCRKKHEGQGPYWMHKSKNMCSNKQVERKRMGGRPGVQDTKKERKN